MKYAALVSSVFAGDFFLKKQIEEHYDEEKRKEILNGKIVVRKSHNSGAVLNFMEKRPDIVKKACGIVLLILGMIWFLALHRKDNPGVMMGLSLLIGGGASNLYDRVSRGYVVDYFSFQTPWKCINRVVFNLSDMCVFVGGIIFVLSGKRE